MVVSSLVVKDEMLCDKYTIKKRMKLYSPAFATEMKVCDAKAGIAF